jgi:hypothetical protein
MSTKVLRLEKETGVKLEKYEVWHDEANAKKLQEYDKGLCGGVPFYFNTDTSKYICGESSYDELKAWAGK